MTFGFVEPNVVQFVSGKQRAANESWIREEVIAKLKRSLPMVDENIAVTAAGIGLDHYRKHRNVDQAVAVAVDYAIKLEDQFVRHFSPLEAG